MESLHSFGWPLVCFLVMLDRIYTFEIYISCLYTFYFPAVENCVRVCLYRVHINPKTKGHKMVLDGCWSLSKFFMSIFDFGQNERRLVVNYKGRGSKNISGKFLLSLYLSSAKKCKRSYIAYTPIDVSKKCLYLMPRTYKRKIYTLETSPRGLKLTYYKSKDSTFDTNQSVE